jgi:hypothetical protein
MLKENENFKEEHEHLGFTTREEFMRDAARWRLRSLREDIEFVEIPREKYVKLEAAVKEMSTPYRSESDLINRQVDEVLEKYDRWLEEKEEQKKGQRKSEAI